MWELTVHDFAAKFIILYRLQEAAIVTYHVTGIVLSDLVDPHKDLCGRCSYYLP